MLKSELRLLSMKQDRVFVMKSASQEFIAEFLTLFAHRVDQENMVIRIEGVQKNSVQLRNRVDSYVAKHKSRVPQNQSTETDYLGDERRRVFPRVAKPASPN